MDSLFPGCDKYSVLGELERVRPMSGGGQRCSTFRAHSVSFQPLMACSESNARCDDNLGLHMPFPMVQANINSKLITITSDLPWWSHARSSPDSLPKQGRPVRKESSDF